MNQHPLLNIVKLQKRKLPIALYAACSLNELVIKACLESSSSANTFILFETTSNQVNQDGGHSTMTPQQFKTFVEKIANEMNFNLNNLLLGGTRLGPLPWVDLGKRKAMDKACELVQQYVLAGFTKIHIDTGMRLRGDNTDIPLSIEVIAGRSAMLVEVSMNAYQQLLIIDPNAMHPVFVIGSAELNEDSQDIPHRTQAFDCLKTVTAFKRAFLARDLHQAWDHVVGLAVQPGINFTDTTVYEYDRKANNELIVTLEGIDNIVFEGQSTDYQTSTTLKELVEDGFGVITVGPELTFALREGLFALARIEKVMYHDVTVRSNFIEILDKTMLSGKSNWKDYYHGTKEEIAFKRKYSFNDRSRYYLSNKNVKQAINIMFDNLRTQEIPVPLLSSYMPIQYNKVRSGQLSSDPEELVKDFVKTCIDKYLIATRQTTL